MTEQGATEIDDRNIVQRMCAIQSEVGYISKDSVNQEQHYRFRGIDAFMNALHPLLPKHGVIVAPRVIERASFERDRFRQGQVVGVTRVVELLVEFTFHGIDGTSLVVVAAGEGADVADKATNKAMAGALKYAIMQTFMVPTQEIVDADATTPPIDSNSSRASAQREVERTMPPRDEIMRKLDEACAALDKTRAKLTEKWRAANNIGPATKLDDPAEVSDVVLYEFVLSVWPYVQQAQAQKQASEPDVPPPSDEEREAAKRTTDVVICDATREHVVNEQTGESRQQKCTAIAGHEGDHTWW